MESKLNTNNNNNSNNNLEPAASININDGSNKSTNNCYIPCDDCMLNNKKIEAYRYCKVCNKSLCPLCVIDKHSKHIEEAKINIDDYFSSLYSQLEDINLLNRKVEDYSEDLKKHEDSLKQQINEIFFKTKKDLQKQIEKIKITIVELENLKNKEIKRITDFFDKENNLLFDKVTSPIYKGK